ncbi:hypothetical protein SprV_0301223900 [Sparganum proliferum]
MGAPGSKCVMRAASARAGFKCSGGACGNIERTFRVLKEARKQQNGVSIVQEERRSKSTMLRKRCSQRLEEDENANQTPGVKFTYDELEVKFTMEEELNNPLTLLNIQVAKPEDGKIRKTVYRKVTNTSRIPFYGSNHPVGHKRSYIKKAFDSVPHQRLLHKLRNAGIRGRLLAWIQSFLAGRSQRVQVGRQQSSEVSVIDVAVDAGRARMPIFEEFSRLSGVSLCDHFSPVPIEAVVMLNDVRKHEGQRVTSAEG